MVISKERQDVSRIANMKGRKAQKCSQYKIVLMNRESIGLECINLEREEEEEKNKAEKNVIHLFRYPSSLHQGPRSTDDDSGQHRTETNEPYAHRASSIVLAAARASAGSTSGDGGSWGRGSEHTRLRSASRSSGLCGRERWGSVGVHGRVSAEAARRRCAVRVLVELGHGPRELSRCKGESQ